MPPNLWRIIARPAPALASIESGPRVATIPKGNILLQKAECGPIECRLMRAYVRLFLAPEGDSCARTVPLARFGSYEVRLVELTKAHADDVTPLWMELYSHDLRHGLDSCGCRDIEEAVLAAEQLVSQASQLNDESRRI